MAAMEPNAAAPGWQPHQVRRIDGERYTDWPAERQVPTQEWNRVAGMPYLAYLPEIDRVLLLCYLDYRPCRPALLTSDDRGDNWSAPALIPTDAAVNPEYGPDYGDTPTSLTYLGGGKVLFSGVAERWASADYGATWEPLPIPPGRNGRPWAGWQWEPCLVDRDAAGRVVRLAETAYSHEGDAYPAPGYFSQAYLRFSDDAGRSWGPEIAPPEWAGVNEVGLIRAADGRIVAACRTDLPQWYRDPAHRTPPGLDPPDLYAGFGISCSRDDGYTWSPVTLLFDHGRHFASPVLLPDGALAMTYVVRIGYPPNADGFPTYGIEALVSRDHGATWDLEHRLILDAWTGNQRGAAGAWWASPQSTSSVLLPDGAILTAYGRPARCLPTPDGQIGPPRDIGLLRWRLPG